MATRTASNVASLSIRGQLSGQQVENTFFYKFPAAITQANLDAVTAAGAAWIAAFLLPNVPPAYVSSEAYAYDMTAGSTLQSTDATTEGDVGSASGTNLPNNATIAVARKSASRGRSYNGRIFWPGLTTAQLSADNIIDAIAGAALVAAVQSLDDSMTALSALSVVLSFTHGGVTTTEAVVSEIAEWVLTDLVLDSRRRRLPKRGS